MRRLLILVVAFASLAATTLCKNEKTESQSAQKPGIAPAFHNTRFAEDWSQFLNDRSQHLWPQLKRVSLGPSDTAFVSFGGQGRLRGESFRGFGFGGPGIRDDSYGLFRLRLHADFVFSRGFRVFIEGKSSLATGRELPGGNRTLDTDSLDLQNLLADVTFSGGGDSSLTFRIGRREIQYGRQRLASPLDWGNTRPRAFDGIAAIWKGGGWQVDSFWSKYIHLRKYRFNKPDPSTQFFGVYGAGIAGPHKLDVYWLGLDRKSATFGGVSGRDQRHTFGARLAGAVGSQFDFDFESAYQAGDHAGRTVKAMMIGSQFGWKPGSIPANLRIFTGLDYGSGDSDPTDGTVGTFNQLFPLGHAFLGHIDAVGRQNIIDWSQGVSLTPVRRLNLTLANHLFWRATELDALYNVAGSVLRAGGPATSKWVGDELNIDGSVPVNRHFATGFGYGHFFAGAFIEETGSSDDIDFWYLSLQFTF